MRRAQILCLIVHYAQSPDQAGTAAASGDEAFERRRKLVNRAMEYTKGLSAIADIDIAVCGIQGFNILPVDIDYRGRIETPLHILWQMLADARKMIAEYDSLLIMEDDILAPRSTIARMIQAQDEIADPRHVIFPNRIEFMNGMPIANDLFAMTGWTGKSITWRSKQWYEARNPHSAFLFLGPRQLEVMMSQPLPAPNTAVFGLIETAFWAGHAGFTLFREKALIPRHYIIHSDNWLRRHNVTWRRAMRIHMTRYKRQPNSPSFAFLGET